MAAALLLPSAAAAASLSDPSQWPDQAGTDPEMVATANTIRFAGADRYQTNLALNLALRGSGGFPFSTSDRTEGGVGRLAQAKQWWGAASCPRSIIVVAGDAVADSLAAASLSDPTDRSDQPRLQRVAAADPLFDPPGGFARVDNAYAPIVVTTSARSGATSLAPTARLTASDLAKGGCTLARQAIIVGGTAAVPTGAEAELVSLGYDSVFRVAGTDRYDTAARVATAMGTGTPPPAGTECIDPTTSDGVVTTGYYGNATIEYRSVADTCRLRSRTVVLADGVAGIDALAAGWWTSYWQVPVLLAGPGGSLPPATRVALQTLDIDTIVVLGGKARIPDTTMDQAGQLAGATPGRFDGSDRYATSVEMAQQFGGWYAAPGATFANDVLCLSASSGPSGSPDALAAGPFCSRLGAARVGSPARAEPPVEGAAARTLTVGGLAGGHSAVPVLLVPPGGTLSAAVANFLAATFAAPRCTGDAAPIGCAQPGFAVIVGGGVGPGAVAQLGQLLADRDVAEHTPIADGFATRLDLRPVFAALAPTPSPSPQVCYGSDTLANVRWLSWSTDATRRTFLGQRDVLRDGWYEDGASAPNCMVLPKVTSMTVTGVGVAGQVSAPLGYDLTPSAALSVTGPIRQAGTVISSASSTSWAFDQAPDDDVDLVRGGVFRTVVGATLGLDLTSRPGAPGVGVVAGRVALSTTFGGQVSGTIRADARQVGGAWELAGVVELGPFAEGRLRGGFRATISTGAGPSPRISWAVDGLPTG